MSTNIDELTRLRHAFSAAPPTDVPRADCPPASRIWEGVRGELAPAEFRVVIHHVASCTVCTEAWRLAEKLEENSDTDLEEDSEDAPGAPHASRLSWFRGSGVAAAALVVLAVGFQFRDFRDGATVLRSGTAVPGGPDSGTIELLNQGPCPRQDCVLRWRGPKDAEYNVRVSSAADFMSTLAEASELKTPEYRIPWEALAELPPSAKLRVHIVAIDPMKGELDASNLPFTVQ